MRRLHITDTHIKLAGALDVVTTPAGSVPRLPTWTRSQIPDGTMDTVVQMAWRGAGAALEHDALDRGIDDRGLFHWTAVDNHERLHDYDVFVGLIAAHRSVRPSATVLASEALSTEP